jgi:SynChlorMet cassette radical SAM/SPASM protein ScmE
MTRKNVCSQKNSVMRTPRHVDVEITSRCNLRCRYCYYFDNPAVKYHDLSTNEWLQFFDELGQCAVMDVTIQGGEPFIRKDLATLLEGIVRNGMRFSILSNGTLIDDEIAAFIFGTGRCNYVQVSIDGSRPEIHDTCRGKGSFARAIKGILTLQKYDVPVTARVTIHRNNVDDLENIARLLLEDLGLKGFGTNSAEYLGSCRHNANDVMLTTRERHQAMETLEQLVKRYNGRISAAAGPLTEARLWSRMEEARIKGTPAFPNGGRLTACGCSGSKIAARADGVIIPCCMLPQIELGRINSDSLEEFEFCADCAYIPYCTGNCPGLAHNLTGQVDHPSPDACLRRYLEDGGLLPGAKQLAG